MRLRIRNTRLTLQIISWLQIAGGIMGIYVVAKLMLQTSNINGALLLIFMLGCLLFSYSIYAGKKLFTDTNKKDGIIYTIINYAIQIFQWFLFGYGFTYSSGGELTVGLQGAEIKFYLGFTSNFAMSIHGDDPFFVKINLFAVLILIVLFDILSEKRTIKKEIKEQEAELVSTSTLPTHP